MNTQTETIGFQMIEINELRNASRSMSDNKAVESAHSIYETPEDIMRNVCNLLGVSETEIKDKDRTQWKAEARQIAMVLMLKAGFSQKQIGLLFGRDHSTVIHARDKVKATTYRNDKNFYEKMRLVGIV